MKQVFRLLLGLGGEKNARAVQLVWLLVGPELAIIFALLLEGVGLMSWLLLGSWRQAFSGTASRDGAGPGGGSGSWAGITWRFSQ